MTTEQKIIRAKVGVLELACEVKSQEGVTSCCMT